MQENSRIKIDRDFPNPRICWCLKKYFQKSKNLIKKSKSEKMISIYQCTENKETHTLQKRGITQWDWQKQTRISEKRSTIE